MLNHRFGCYLQLFARDRPRGLIAERFHPLFQALLAADVQLGHDVCANEFAQREFNSGLLRPRANSGSQINASCSGVPHDRFSKRSLP